MFNGNDHLTILAAWYSILANVFTYIIHFDECYVKCIISPFKYVFVLCVSCTIFPLVSYYLKSRAYNFIRFCSHPVFLHQTVNSLNLSSGCLFSFLLFHSHCHCSFSFPLCILGALFLTIHPPENC